MTLSSNGVTPLDVAAKNRSHSAAILMIDQFIKRKDYISQIFCKKASDPNKITPRRVSFPWEIKTVNAKQLSPIQSSFVRLFFWAGFYDERKTIEFFLSELGISPFLKMYRFQCVIDACIIGKHYDLLEYLIKDTYKGINNTRSEEDKLPVKYKIANFLDLDYYWKSRQSKDKAGNNSCHILFSVIDDEQLRFKFLKLLT